MGNVMIPQTTKEPVAWAWTWTTPSVHNNNEKKKNNNSNNNNNKSNNSNLWPICGAKSNPYRHHAHEKYNTSGAKEMDDVGSRNTDSTSGSPNGCSLYHCNKRKQQRQQSTSASSSWFLHQRRRRAIQEELELLPSDVAVVHVVHHCHDRSVVPGVHANASGTPPSSASTASSTPSCSPAVVPQRSVSIPMKNSKNNHSNNNNNNKERLDPTSQQDQHQRDGIDCHQTDIAQDPHVQSSRCEQHYHDSCNRQHCHADTTEAEEDEVDDDGGCDEEHLLQRFYDMRTWEMYLRITEARRRFAAAAAAARPAHALPPMMMMPIPIPTTAPTTREYQQQQKQPQYKPSNIVKDSSMTTTTTSSSTTTNMTAENLLATAFHLRHHSVHRGHDHCEDDVDAVAVAPVVCAPVAVDPQTWILQHAMAIMEPHLPPLHYGNNGHGQILCRGGASADAHANAGPGPTWVPILEPLHQQTVPWSGPVLNAVRPSCGTSNNNNLYMPWLSQHHTSSSLSLSSSNNDHEMIFGDMD